MFRKTEFTMMKRSCSSSFARYTICIKNEMYFLAVLGSGIKFSFFCRYLKTASSGYHMFDPRIHFRACAIKLLGDTTQLSRGSVAISQIGLGCMANFSHPLSYPKKYDMCSIHPFVCNSVMESFCEIFVERFRLHPSGIPQCGGLHLSAIGCSVYTTFNTLALTCS